MSQFYQNLIERIRGEVSDLEQVVARAKQSWSMVQKAPVEEYVYSVISQESAARIDEFRRFRHVVRSAYTVDLVPQKMARLVETLPELWPKLKAELLAFADYLEALNESFQTP